MNITSKTLMTMAAAMAITLTGWAKTLPGVAPLSPEKLAAWRAEEMRINAPKAAAKSDLAFYTGKPYDTDLNAYLFPFRNYSPDLCRWTVADPSGFPDGANNYCYAPTPNMGCDPLGLWKFEQLTSGISGYYFGTSEGDRVYHNLTNGAQGFLGCHESFSGYGTDTLIRTTTIYAGINFYNGLQGNPIDFLQTKLEITSTMKVDSSGHLSTIDTIHGYDGDINNSSLACDF
jgi:RHS repeat-associated protein